MATSKPTKPTDLMPETFATDGVKNNFSLDKIQNGFSANFEDIFQGDNINYMLDSIGKQLKYLNTVVDYINAIGVKKVPYINASNQLDSGDIDTLLPTQSGNSGKYLTTNGTNCSWSNDFRIIGEPIFTLNFNYTLPSNCVWLDGTAGENNDGVVPTTGDWATLFSIYGWQYDTSYTNTGYFKLPNFTNKTIWGGTSAGYVEAGLPNITGKIDASNQGINAESFGETYAQITGVFEGIYGYQSATVDASVGGTMLRGFNFDASRSNPIYGNSNTVQPPAIKVRVYTRYK